MSRGKSKKNNGSWYMRNVAAPFSAHHPPSTPSTPLSTSSINTTCGIFLALSNAILLDPNFGTMGNTTGTVVFDPTNLQNSADMNDAAAASDHSAYVLTSEESVSDGFVETEDAVLEGEEDDNVLVIEDASDADEGIVIIDNA
jgi:hypothetical protein